ncbi:uncharacterized protein Z520_04155 [Fonsecaea multimorphosa CBS 102226]|uniref:Uncharacterized protein n=1 Tax=Fonsecaea multimorphosa CBS 102226 TaxID=1442371 RepID=A0A0D2KBI0_9EURO|nr:uncharacterized protein Z520_04155 [Fonsecaea multimorphosa CBS 102226]KIY00470.1 hypothetical protein Z520_04155 [Fonsecaea multimorphosa CBS 102226]OAL26984.1 hypothetical protein AYO22_03928 [Fonsecaea multimorphosa]
MALTRILTTIATCFLVFGTALAAADVSNSSQHIVPNAAGDTAIDADKVRKYKSLLDELSWRNKFDEGLKWHDIIDSYTPANADCTPRCLTCAPGCNPRCCALDSSQQATSDSDKAKKDSSPDAFISRPNFPGIVRPLPPIPALGCPCHCESWCPRNVQIICCFTPASSMPDEPAAAASARQQTGVVDDEDAQKTLLDQIVPGTQEHFWGHPNLPLACPCFCAPTCPAYIQAICCTTPGSDSRTIREPPQKPHDVLAMVTETVSGNPVSVLAAINLTVFDSFITMNLVRGLHRASEIAYNHETKTFEVTLAVAVRGLPNGAKQALAHTFVVVDGSRLLEEEQILLGAGFMNRIGVSHAGGALSVNKDFLAPLEEGLPVLTGV